jgi:hypothetical protein
MSWLALRSSKRPYDNSDPEQSDERRRHSERDDAAKAAESGKSCADERDRTAEPKDSTECELRPTERRTGCERNPGNWGKIRPAAKRQGSGQHGVRFVHSQKAVTDHCPKHIDLTCSRGGRVGERVVRGRRLNQPGEQRRLSGSNLRGVTPK